MILFHTTEIVLFIFGAKLILLFCYTKLYLKSIENNLNQCLEQKENIL